MDCLLHFTDESTLAGQIAAVWGVTALPIDRHRFPDGELRLRLPATLPPQVTLLRSLANPNEKLIELVLAAGTARELGASHLTLVAPYLAYMRQDIAFHPGEAVSQRLVGRLLAGLFDRVITVDPHLHRVATLGEAIACAQPVALSAAPLLGALVARRRPGAMLVGPDEESAQWVAQAAQAHGLAHRVCRKVRTGDRAVQVALPEGPYTGRAVVLLDDMCSTGHTAAQTAVALLSAGAASVDIAVTHALFSIGAEATLREAGIGEIWSTDCIPHPSNAVAVAPLLAAALREVAESTET